MSWGSWSQCEVLAQPGSGAGLQGKILVKRLFPGPAWEQSEPKRLKRAKPFGVLRCVCVWSTLLKDMELGLQHLLVFSNHVGIGSTLLPQVLSGLGTSQSVWLVLFKSSLSEGCIVQLALDGRGRLKSHIRVTPPPPLPTSLSPPAHTHTRLLPLPQKGANVCCFFYHGERKELASLLVFLEEHILMAMNFCWCWLVSAVVC